MQISDSAFRIHKFDAGALEVLHARYALEGMHWTGKPRLACPVRFTFPR